VACHEADTVSSQDVVFLFSVTCELIIPMGKERTIIYVLVT